MLNEGWAGTSEEPLNVAGRAPSTTGRKLTVTVAVPGMKALVCASRVAAGIESLVRSPTFAMVTR